MSATSADEVVNDDATPFLKSIEDFKDVLQLPLTELHVLLLHDKTDTQIIEITKLTEDVLSYQYWRFDRSSDLLKGEGKGEVRLSGETYYTNYRTLWLGGEAHKVVPGIKNIGYLSIDMKRYSYRLFPRDLWRKNFRHRIVSGVD